MKICLYACIILDISIFPSHKIQDAYLILEANLYKASNYTRFFLYKKHTFLLQPGCFLTLKQKFSKSVRPHPYRLYLKNAF